MPVPVCQGMGRIHELQPDARYAGEAYRAFLFGRCKLCLTLYLSPARQPRLDHMAGIAVQYSP